MKKILFIIAVLGITMNSFAKTSVKETSEFLQTTKKATSTMHQDIKDVLTVAHDDVTAITATLYGDGKSAITALYPEVKSAVVSIAKAIGVAAEHVYSVLVKKFVVDAIVQLLPFICGLILLIIGWIKMSQYFKLKDKVEWHILYPLLLLIFGIIFLGIVDYNTMVMGLVNPEYGALNYILEYSKQMLQ